HWSVETTLLRAELGAAQRVSEDRTGRTELAPDDADRKHRVGSVSYQWTPGHWAGIRAHHRADDGKLKSQGQVLDDLDKTSNGDLTWVGLQADSDAYNYRSSTNQLNYWGSLTWLDGTRDEIGVTSAPNDQVIAGEKHRRELNGWATDLGRHTRRDP
ncbi:transcriptional regulator, partial [Pseudomonas syringae]